MHLNAEHQIQLTLDVLFAQAPTQLSHRDVLQQGIVQLRQRLAKEREDNIAAQMRLARASFVRNAPCRCY